MKEDIGKILKLICFISALLVGVAWISFINPFNVYSTTFVISVVSFFSGACWGILLLLGSPLTKIKPYNQGEGKQ